MEMDIQMGSLLNILQTIKLLYEIWESTGDTALVNSSLLLKKISNILFTVVYS